MQIEAAEGGESKIDAGSSGEEETNLQLDENDLGQDGLRPDVDDSRQDVH